MERIFHQDLVNVAAFISAMLYSLQPGQQQLSDFKNLITDIPFSSSIRSLLNNFLWIRLSVTSTPGWISEVALGGKKKAVFLPSSLQHQGG